MEVKILKAGLRRRGGDRILSEYSVKRISKKTLKRGLERRGRRGTRRTWHLVRSQRREFLEIMDEE